jgi:hypothetical protein
MIAIAVPPGVQDTARLLVPGRVLPPISQVHVTTPFASACFVPSPAAVLRVPAGVV